MKNCAPWNWKFFTFFLFDYNIDLGTVIYKKWEKLQIGSS